MQQELITLGLYVSAQDRFERFFDGTCRPSLTIGAYSLAYRRFAVRLLQLLLYLTFTPIENPP